MSESSPIRTPLAEQMKFESQKSKEKSLGPNVQLSNGSARSPQFLMRPKILVSKFLEILSRGHDVDTGSLIVWDNTAQPTEPHRRKKQENK